MAGFRCERFPDGEVPIRTTAGLVWFRAGRAEVDDGDLVEALREVPPVFGIVEEGGAPERDGDAEVDEEPAAAGRPSVRAPKADWVAYAEQAHGIPAAEAEEMTKAELIETFGG